MRFCQNILSPFWASFFKNLNFFHFSRHIIWMVCRTVTIFLLAQRYNLCKLSNTSNMLVKSTEINASIRGLFRPNGSIEIFFGYIEILSMDPVGSADIQITYIKKQFPNPAFRGDMNVFMNKNVSVSCMTIILLPM